MIHPLDSNGQTTQVTMDELLQMMDQAGGQHDPVNMELFEQLACDFDPYLATVLKDRLSSKYAEIRVKPDPFLRTAPSGKEVAGKYIIGTVPQTGASYGLSASDIHHLYITGSSGSGKSNCCHGLLIKMLQDKTPCLCLSTKRELDGAIKLFPDRVLFFRTSDPCFKLNPLMPPPGVPVIYWLNSFADTLSQAMGLLTASKSFIMENSDELYAIYGIYDDTPDESKIYPSLFDLHTYITTKNYSLYSRDARYCEATLNRIGGLLRATGPVFDCSRGLSLTTLLDSGKSIILSMDALGTEWSQYLINYLLFYIFVYKLNKKGVTGELDRRYMAFLDDSAKAFDISLEKIPEAGMPEISTLVEKGRESIGIIASTQIPTQTMHSLLANSNQIIAFRLSSGKDIKEMQNSMNLSDEQAETIIRQRPGEATIIKEGYPYPAKVHIERYELPQTSNEEVDCLMSDVTPASLGIMPRLKLKDLLASKMPQTISQEKKPIILSPEKRAYAMDIYNRPLIPITVRDESLGYSAAKGHSIRSSLQVNGLVKIVVLGLPGKGFIKLLELTEQGLKELGVSNES